MQSLCPLLKIKQTSNIPTAISRDETLSFILKYIKFIRKLMNLYYLNINTI